jgi:Holliday junction resolvase-like predicted endonuclease
VDCEHSTVRCLNHYDTFRKYLCENCGGVYICECERQLAITFLPHQIRLAVEYGTQKEYPVTGFASNICAECRSEDEEAHPRAAIYGQKGKVARYYWREIFKTYCEYVLNWLQQNSGQVKDINEFKSKHPDIAREFKKKAKKYWQMIHDQSPKYDLKEQTEAEFLSQVRIPLIKIGADYRQIEKNGKLIGKWINQSGELTSVEEIAAEWYRSKGYTVLTCERKFISAWVGTFLALPIQDPSDVCVRPTFRNSTKGWTRHNRNTGLISIPLPEDFGSAEYYKRREVAIQASIQRMRATGNLQILFDELLDNSESLRDYLWVNDDEAVKVARIVLSVLPKKTVVDVVEWAIQDFWHRQPGWPDLFAYKGNDFIFVEVKSPHDELSQEQMNWFQWAIEQAHLPCEICRVKKKKD